MKLTVLLLAQVTRFLLIFAQAGTGLKSAKGGQNKSDAQQISEIERRWAKAEDVYDHTVLNEVLADDFVSMNEAGKVKNKDQEIASDADWKAPGPQLIDDLSIRVYGDIAVVLGQFTYRDKTSGRIVRQGRFVDSFVRRNGKWQVMTNSYVRTDLSQTSPLLLLVRLPARVGPRCRLPPRG